MNVTGLSKRQRKSLRMSGWRLVTSRNNNDLGKLVFDSSPLSRITSPGFIKHAKVARYIETSYVARVVSIKVSVGYAFEARAIEPFNTEAHIWVASGRNLTDFVRFVNRTVTPVLFGVNSPKVHKVGVDYFLANVG